MGTCRQGASVEDVGHEAETAIEGHKPNHGDLRDLTSDGEYRSWRCKMDKRRKPLAVRIEKERRAVRAQLRLLTASRARGSDILYTREEAGGDPEDAPERAQQTLLKEQEIRVYERLTSQAKTLDRAWENLQRGTYGICQQCEQQIPRRRLEAMPGAVFCVACQEKEELAPGVRERAPAGG